MAFSFRRMLSNINYFKKSEDENVSDVALSGDHENTFPTSRESQNIDFGRAEPDSTSKHCATSLKLPDSVKNFAAKKGSLSDTDVLSINVDVPTKREKRKSKKLKIDIQKCSPTMSDIDNSSNNIENTPKHALLDNKSTDLFSQHFKGIDMNHSFDIFEAMSNSSSISEEEQFDIESLTDKSETDISLESVHKEEVRMCRKVEPVSEIPDNQLMPSTTPESFGDVEVERNEEERIDLLLDYQIKLEKLDCILRKLLSEFKFHIEVTKVFHCQSVVTALSGTNVKTIPNYLGQTFINNVSRGVSPTGSWNIIMEKEDDIKIKLRDQLLSMKRYIGDFAEIYLQDQNEKVPKCKKFTKSKSKSMKYDLYKGKNQKHFRLSNKKNINILIFLIYVMPLLTYSIPILRILLLTQLV